MSKIERKPALNNPHPLSGLAQPDPEPQLIVARPAETKPAPAPTPAPSAPEATPAEAAAATEPYLGSVQFNVRAAVEMREHLRVAAAGMTLATGERWSQDRLVRHAVAAYLAELGEKYNGGKPFHER